MNAMMRHAPTPPVILAADAVALFALCRYAGLPSRFAPRVYAPPRADNDASAMPRRQSLAAD